MQLRDEHMREHEKQVSPQFWISSQGGSWKEGQGILPEYAPGARALGVFAHAGEWMKDEHYEEAERSLSRNSRRAGSRSVLTSKSYENGSGDGTRRSCSIDLENGYDFRRREDKRSVV